MANDAVDLHTCHLFPNGMQDWPMTTAITRVAFLPGDGGLHLEFGKKDGPGRWPDVVPPGWDGPIEFTIWFGVVVAGVAEFAACINWWNGRPDRESGPVSDPEHFPRNLWYLNDRLKGRTPVVGEPMGLFVTAGAERGVVAFKVAERSNVVAFRYPGPAGGTFTFDDDPAPPVDPPTDPEPPPTDDLRASLIAGLRDQRDALNRSLERLGAR